MDRHITVPINKEEIALLKAGDYVYITGIIYTARDAAHKRMYDTLRNGLALPIEMKDNIIGTNNVHEEMERELKAIIQQYMNRMVQDRLTPETDKKTEE